MKITLKTKKLLIIIASVLAVLAILVYFLVAMFGHELPDKPSKQQITSETPMELTSAYDIRDFIGGYENSDGLTSKVRAYSDGSMDVTISLDLDNFETEEWTFEGDFDADTGILFYTDATQTINYNIEESEDQVTQTASSTPLRSGRIAFNHSNKRSSFTLIPGDEIYNISDCVFKSVADKPEEETIEIPIALCKSEDIIGRYASDDARIEIRIDDENNMTATVHHAESDKEWNDWTMSGQYDRGNGCLDYSNGVKTHTVIADDNKEKTEELYQDGRGSLSFKREEIVDAYKNQKRYATSLTWEDSAEDGENARIFTRVNESFDKSDLIRGYWGIPKDFLHGTGSLEFEEDGTVTAYYWDDENSQRSSYETSWRIDGFDLIIDNLDGEDRRFAFQRDSYADGTIISDYRSYYHYPDHGINE